MSRVIVSVAVVTFGLSLWGAAFAPGVPGDTPEVPPPIDRSTPREPIPPVLRGFTLSLHHTEQFPLFLRAIDEMAALGLNSVQVATPAYQTDGSTVDVRVESGPNRGPDRDQLLHLLKHAKSRGLTTALMPQVLFTSPRGNEWRGKIHPEQWDPWWESYRRVVDYFLDVANESDLDILCIGSELLSTEKQPDRWSALIDHARERFPGRLIYSTNWDHFHVPTIWNKLDMIGISGYWDVTTLTDPAHPDPAKLALRWREIRGQVMAFAAERRLPVVFTEIGYPSLPWGLKDPWNYINDDGLASTPGVQAMGYGVFLEAWRDLLCEQQGIPTIQTPAPASMTTGLSPMAGVFFYEWDPYRAGDDHDTGYGVRGKPTMDILKAWLAECRQAESLAR
jgi:hypothetical protein